MVTTVTVYGGPCHHQQVDLQVETEVIEAPHVKRHGKEFTAERYTRRRFYLDGVPWRTVYAHHSLDNIEVLKIIT